MTALSLLIGGVTLVFGLAILVALIQGDEGDE